MATDYKCVLFLVPEIDCGDPMDVMPSGGMYVSPPQTTTYFSDTSRFTFTCGNGSDSFGEAENGGEVVRCKANGRWGFGTLACQGKSHVTHNSYCCENSMFIGIKRISTMQHK